MRIALSIYLMIHGFCHLVGFVVPWKIATMKDEPYKTTLLSGAWDVGDAGIRIVGSLWLLTGLAFMASAIGEFTAWPTWRPLALGFAVFSLIICVFGLPGARIGILANALVLAYFLGCRLGWVS